MTECFVRYFIDTAVHHDTNATSPRIEYYSDKNVTCIKQVNQEQRGHRASRFLADCFSGWFLNNSCKHNTFLSYAIQFFMF